MPKSYHIVMLLPEGQKIRLVGKTILVGRLRP